MTKHSAEVSWSEGLVDARVVQRRSFVAETTMQMWEFPKIGDPNIVP